MDNIHFRELTIEDVGRLEDYLKNVFAIHEPATSHLKTPPAEFWRFFKAMMEVSLKSGVTFGAFDKTNDVMCGISVNLLGNAEVPEPNLQDPHHISVKQLYSLLKQTYPDGMANDVGTNNYLEIFFLGVMEEYGKRGIGTELCRRSVEKARQRQCSHVTIDCTSAYSRKACENLGFHVIRELVYEDYVDRWTGNMVMKGVPKPHYASTLLALKL